MYPHYPEHRIRRDQVLLLLGWAAARRTSELVAIDVEHIRFTDPTGNADTVTEHGGMVVHIPRSKTDQHGAGFDILVPYSSTPTACPVRTTFLHCRALGTGPLFRHIDRHGNQGHRMHHDTPARILKQHLGTVYNGDVDPRLYSSHSLRAGFVTEAANQGVPERIIAHTTGHESLATIRTYDRPENRFDDIALAGEWW